MANAAPGYGWVRRSTRVHPRDVAPYEWLDEQTPQMRRVACKERIRVMNESNPRYGDFINHEARLQSEAEICAIAQHGFFNMRNGYEVTDDQFHAILDATRIFRNFEPIVSEKAVLKVMDYMGKEVIQ